MQRKGKKAQTPDRSLDPMLRKPSCTTRTLDALSARRAERVHTRLHGKKPPRRRQKRNIETTFGAVACCAKPLCGHDIGENDAKIQFSSRQLAPAFSRMA